MKTSANALGSSIFCQAKLSFVLFSRHGASLSRRAGGFVTIAALLGLGAGILPRAFAQKSFTQTIDATYNNITSGYALPNDFIGLSFETESLQSGNGEVNYNGPTNYFFVSSNPELVTLFQQMGIRNLRVGGGSVGNYTNCTQPCDTYRPALPGGTPLTEPDIDALFGFAQAAGLKVIYSVPVTDATSGDLSVNDTTLESYDEQIVSYIMGYPTGSTNNNNYTSLVDSFAIGNEMDFFHLRESTDPCYTGSSTPPTIPCYISTYWSPIQNSIASYIAGEGSTVAQFSGPDSGNSSGKSSAYYSGSLCGGTFPGGYWAYGFAFCAQQTPWPFFTKATAHLYPGGAACNASATCYTADQTTVAMLSSSWTTNSSGTENCASTTCPYNPFGFFYQTVLGSPNAGAGYPKYAYRLTELNDFDQGTPGASDAFAGALFALDVMHWFAYNQAAGTNFHNYQWISTDTIVPGDLTQYIAHYPPNQPFICTGNVCNNFRVTPRGYGIKAFDLGSHGYTVGVTYPAYDLPNSTQSSTNSIDTYAVGSGQDLYVTLVNKSYAPGVAADEADVTIDISTSDAPFAAASVASLQLWNNDSSAPSDPEQLTATLGGGSITNDGTQWPGLWTAQPAMTSGQETISVQPGQAMIVHFHAPSNYVGPIQMNQDGGLEMDMANSSGTVYHQYQQESDLNSEPNSAVSNWSSAVELSGSTVVDSPAGDIAVTKNLDNTLQVFVPTSGDVFYIRQVKPTGSWGAWTDMGSSSAGISHLKAAQNADGSLAVFGLDSSGNLWYATENAPGVAWSNWTELSGQTISSGYVVGDNLSGRLEVFGESGGNVYHIWQTLSNGWSAWHEIAANTGQTLQAWLQVARDVSGALNLFALDATGNVWTNYQSAPAGAWQSTWTELPTSGLLTSSPAGIQPGFVAGQDANGCFELFGVQNDDNVYHIWNPASSGCSTSTWSSAWQDSSFSGVPSGGFDPHLMVSNTNDGRLQIFAVAKNSPFDIWSNWQSGISGLWTNWEDFGSSTSGMVLYPGQP
jgi:hypothetical protein